MKYIDGGYFSWTFGVYPAATNNWVTAKKDFTRDNEVIFLMDGEGSYREDYYPSYKERRREKYEDNPEIQAKKARVKNFQEQLVQDPSILHYGVDGLEADDLVGLIAYLEEEQVEVTGIDKDLLQLKPGIRLIKMDGEPVTIENFSDRHPKTLQPYINSPDDVLLSLVLMGDRSDSIPRLIPPYELELMVDILEDDDPWQRAIQLFTWEEVTTNLYLAVLPGPWCFDYPDDHYIEFPTEEVVFSMVRDGTWPPMNQLKPDIHESLAKIMKGETEEVTEWEWKNI